MVELRARRVQLLLPDARAADEEGGAWDEEEVEEHDACGTRQADVWHAQARRGAGDVPAMVDCRSFSLLGER